MEQVFVLEKTLVAYIGKKMINDLTTFLISVAFVLGLFIGGYINGLRYCRKETKLYKWLGTIGNSVDDNNSCQKKNIEAVRSKLNNNWKFL